MSKSKMRDHMWWKLLGDDELVREALLELYFQQTQDERNSTQTTYANQFGFSKAHVKLGTLLARKLLKEHNLSAEEMKQARRLVMHYPRQIVHLIPVSRHNRAGELMSA